MSENVQSEKIIAFVLYPGLTPLDLVGPLQAMNAQGPVYRTVVVGERMEPVSTDVPLKLTPTTTFDDVPHPFCVIVPGGGMPTYQAMADTRLRDWLISAADGAEIVGSVCTGALILAAAGLLRGRQATTHWAHSKVLEKLGATYVRQRWVEDGKFITSAGVSAGIDMALHLLGRFMGEPVARQVQLGLEYDPEPPYGHIDWSLADFDAVPNAVRPLLPNLFASRPDLYAQLKEL